MYFPYYIAYMTSGFFLTLVVFFWALNQGQFNDQNRARYIPLKADIESKPLQPSRFARLETYALFVLVGIALAASMAVVTYSLFKANV